MRRTIAILALIGIALAVPVKQREPRRRERRENESHASYQSRLINSVSAPRALPTRFEDVRLTDPSIGSVGDPSDRSILKLKRGKRVKHRRPKAIEETKFAVFQIDFTTQGVAPVSTGIVRRPSVPLPVFGSGLCYSLPRPRGNLIGSSSLSGSPAV